MKSVITSMSVAVALVACGGGGGDAPPTIPEGLYHQQYYNYFTGGRLSTLLVLENQEVWIQSSSSDSLIQFFVHGTFPYTGKGADATGVAYEGIPYTIYSQPKALASVSADVLLSETAFELHHYADAPSYGPKLVAMFPGMNGWPLYGLFRTPATGFDYNKAASLQDVSGAWQGLTVDPSTGTITGTGTDQWSACTLAGTLTPRPSGKNVFNLSLTLSGCADSGAYSGVAITYTASPSGFDSSGPATYLKLLTTTTSPGQPTKMFHRTAQR